LVTSSPKKRIVPEVGGKSPVMQLNSVVFPAHRQGDVRQRRERAEKPRHAAQFERGSGADC
jgi:hypothetical protein